MKEKKLVNDYVSFGLNPIPLDGKIPLIKGWEKERTKDELTKNSYRDIGVCTGIVSEGLEAIDFDLKYADEPQKLLNEWKKKVGSEILKKLVVQKTVNNGYHFIYRCQQIEGNKILAKNLKDEVLIETRGEGGFIKVFPSEGYEMVQGSFDSIPIITPSERNKMFVSAYMLDQKMKASAKIKRTSEKFGKFPKYDSDPEIGLALLEKHGWKIMKETADWIELQRPDKDDGLSGGYNLEGNFLFVHSTSTCFRQQHPYNNYAIFAELECAGDYSEAYKKLNEMGFGDGKYASKSGRSAKSIQIAAKAQEELENSIEDLTFVSTREEEVEFLRRSVENKIPVGLTTGWKDLDEYFRFKQNSFNMGIGYDGVGKSVLMLSLAAASNLLHDWKWGMVLPENRTAMSRRRLIECMSGKTIDQFQNAPKEYNKYLDKAMNDFHIVANRHHYSLKDAIEMGKKLYEHYGINALLIDPWNFFKSGGKDTYSWNNEILSELRVFAEQYCSVYVMAHPSSESPRKNVDESGYLKAPRSYDIQGGADFPYRVDDFFVFHRILNHPSKEVQRTMQFIVHKVKEVETGGKRHTLGEYTALRWMEKDGFLGYWDEHNNNPMYSSLNKGLKSNGLVTDATDYEFIKKNPSSIF